jgi:hypothetical protein
MSELFIGHVTFDCDDAALLARFWSGLLGYPVDAGASEAFASVGRGANARPVLLFIKVPDRNTGKNTPHLDLHSLDWPAHVDQAIRSGATKLAQHAEHGTQWVTLADPEGNLFDIGAGM